MGAPPSAKPTPLRNSYWVIPGKVLAGEHPGGSNRESTREKLQRLIDAGVECFIDLTEPNEIKAYDRELPFSVEYLRKPIKDHSTPAQRVHMAEILDCIHDALQSGRCVYVHCRAGIGRTGTVVGCFLVERGLPGESALDELNRLWQQCERSQSWASIPETSDQTNYVARWKRRGIFDDQGGLTTPELQPSDDEDDLRSGSGPAPWAHLLGNGQPSPNAPAAPSSPLTVGAPKAVIANAARAAARESDAGELLTDPTSVSKLPQAQKSRPGVPSWIAKGPATAAPASSNKAQGLNAPPPPTASPALNASPAPSASPTLNAPPPPSSSPTLNAPPAPSASPAFNASPAPNASPPLNALPVPSASPALNAPSAPSASSRVTASSVPNTPSAPAQASAQSRPPSSGSPRSGKAATAVAPTATVSTAAHLAKGPDPQASPGPHVPTPAGAKNAPQSAGQLARTGSPAPDAAPAGNPLAPTDPRPGNSGVFQAVTDHADVDSLLDPQALAAASNLRGRFLGALIGLAIGDAVAAATQYRRPGSFTPVGDMLGGGPFDLPRGGWSDDTAMALCLADSLLERNGFDARDQMERYRRWQQQGYLSATGQCIGITASTTRAIAMAQWRRQPLSGSHDPSQQDPEPLSRVAAAVLFFFATSGEAINQATEAARTTCQAPAVLDACRALARALYAALTGQSKAAVLEKAALAVTAPVVTPETAPANGASAVGSGPVLAQRVGSSAPAALAAAVAAFGATDNFRDAILYAANLGGDSDVVAAVCGQLAGAYYSVKAIPTSWHNGLMQKELIIGYADRLLAHAMVGLGG